jgi:Relaxase/Mobilisation nuclease domain
MIAKITKGSGFGGVVRYVLDRDKQPIMLTGAKQCWGDNASDIALGLTKVAKFRPTTKLPVRHFSIGFGENDKLTDDIKTEIVVRIMEEMGYADCQYFAVKHGRVVEDHHHAHKHDHLHIVANAITPHGKRITDSKDYYRMELCLRKIEKDYGLEEVHNSWEKVKKLRAEIAPSELKYKIDRALIDSPSLKEWIDRLEVDGVNVRFRITSRGCVQGISYVHQGELKKGSNVGHSWRDLSSRFSQTPENLELMRGANLKTQSLSVELKPEDRALLTKAADLAMQKLVDGKFNDKSVQISLVDDVLKVRRLRPNKIIFSAKKDSEGEWQSIGIPNIDARKDLQILGDVAKVDVEIVQMDKSLSKVSKRPHQIKSRRRSNELE